MNNNRNTRKLFSWQHRLSLLVHFPLVLNAASINQKDIEGVWYLCELLCNIVDIQELRLNSAVVAGCRNNHQSVLLIHHSVALDLDDIHLVGVDCPLGCPFCFPQHTF